MASHPPGSVWEAGEGEGSLQSPKAVGVRLLGGGLCWDGCAVDAFSDCTEQEGKEQQERGSKEKLVQCWV